MLLAANEGKGALKDLTPKLRREKRKGEQTMHEVLHQHIIRKGVYNDFFLMEKINSILAEERVLDAVPEPIKLKKADTEYIGGLAETFRKTFEGVSIDYDRPCILKVKGKEIRIEPPAMRALKTILLVGVSKDQDVADSCRKVFLSALSKCSEYLSIPEMLSKIPEDTYYCKILKDTIMEEIGCTNS